MAIGFKSGINIDGNSTVTGTFSVSSVSQDNSTYTGIMVWDGGVLKYRTKSQILSDIGAGSGSGTVTNVSLGTLTGLSGSISNATSTPQITLTNTDAGSSQNIFKTVAVSGQTSITAASNSQTLTVVAAGGMTITTNNSTKTLTLNSANDNDNNYVTSVSFNTSSGVLTLNRNGLSATTVDLDGRYVEKTGDTMTGDLTMDGAGIIIDTDTAGNSLVWKESDSSTNAGQLRGYANRGDIYLYNNGVKKTEISSSNDSFIPALHIGGTAAASGGVLQTTGNVNIDGTLNVSSTVTIGSIANASASNTFLVSDSGVVKYRTAAQVRSDIGAVTSSGVTSVATSNGITGGTITSTGTVQINYSGNANVIKSASNLNSLSKEDTFIFNSAENSTVYETTISQIGTALGGVTGSGTANTLPKWNGTTSLTNSEITDTGSLIKLGNNSSGQETLYIDTNNRKVGFRTQTPGSAFDVNGTFRARNEINCGVTNEQNLFVAGGVGAQYVKMGAYTKAANFLGISGSENLLKTTAGFGANGKIVQASRFYTTKIEQGGWPTAAGLANGKALTPTPGSNQVMYIRNIFVNKTSSDTGTGWSSGTYPIEFGWLGSGTAASRFIAGIPRSVIISTNPNTWWYQVTINAESNNPYGTPFGPVANKPLVLNTPSAINSTKQPTMYIQVEYTLVNISNFRTNVDQTYTAEEK